MLIYEDINLETGYSYSVYRRGLLLSEARYLVYECDPDGHKTFIGEFSKSEALALVRTKCK